ncbi:unnamed protein product [Calicophoron daubneyi]|uniref:Fe2OG dioxygenase domain-containing protein n=1 Tax=Calicophoron daubneyi TaxID=300641 RepID=A0AAV2T5I6_CALDB
MRYCALLFLCLFSTVTLAAEGPQDLIVLTVATESNDALERFLRSARLNGFEVEVLGQGVPWTGGDVASTVGGGQKVRLLKEGLEKYKNNNKLLILFTDSYDVIFTDTKEKLLLAYNKLGSAVIFSAEDFCWPRKDLADSYPNVKPNEKRFLNSGAFMGPASILYEIVSKHEVHDDDDDQLYYTQIFLDTSARHELDIALDRTASLFQNLNGALDEVEIRFHDDTGYLYNNRTGTTPVVAHGNGPIKTEFNALTNYLAHSWTPRRGCQHCTENTIEVKDPEKYPIIQVSVFIEYPTPFFEEFLKKISGMSYPKNKIHFTGHISKKAGNQRHIGDAFNVTQGYQYRSSVWFDANEVQDEGSARNRAFAHCLAIEDCQFVFMIDGIVHVNASNILEHLVHMNRSIVAPVMTRRGKLWANFWGAIGKDGYYARSEDYVDIVEGRKVGLWNVPFIRDVYMISRNAIRMLWNPKLANANEVDMKISNNAREKNIFMWADNQRRFGHLIYPDTYTTEHLHNDLWQIFDNPLDWEEKYVDAQYLPLLKPEVKMMDIQQPCPDVFAVPLVTEKFCRDLIEEMEFYGAWSSGTNYDPRLEGGYENVPTRDIHMRQVNWEEHWLHFLRTYVHPMQKKLFQGYEDRPWARMAFVVRYKPDEQASLRAHHDASSFTVNIALNRQGIDYQGGGTYFNRYNCSAMLPIPGWAAMFPGRVTHLHEGLRTTAGVRYIFVTFVNP